jgi:hypothetical protein|tara:strand:- start:467 stop:1606 length:1140 start_codon:yes stop_codon:yes gene_type:complete
LRWLPEDLGNPPVIIVDRTGAAVVAELIPKNIGYWVLPVRDEERYLNWQTLIYFLSHLPWVLTRKVNMLGLYVLSIAYSTRASVLVTFIDNCSWDKGLSDVTSLRVITIQNGLRTVDTISRKRYDIFLGFSLKDTNAAQGAANEAIPIGSVRLGLAYRERQAGSTRAENQSIDILFVSQFRPEFWASPHFEDRLHVDVIKTTLGWIRTLAAQHRLRVGIAFTSKGPDREAWYQKEKSVYQALMEIPFAEYHRERFTRRGFDCTYAGLFDARVVVSVSSTLCFEAIGIGKPPVMTTRLFGDVEIEHYDWFPRQQFHQFMVAPGYESFEHAVLAELAGDREQRPIDLINKDYYCAFDKESLPPDRASEIICQVAKSATLTS